VFIVLGNASGNAIAFGIFVLQAAGYDSDHLSAAAVRGLALAALTAACLLHGSWRRGGILLNNLVACLKVLILLAIIGIGFAALAGASFGHGKTDATNLAPHTSFNNPTSNTASYADSFLYVVWSYNFKQPFYVSLSILDPFSYLRVNVN
jgi:hypothetical protein